MAPFQPTRRSFLLLLLAGLCLRLAFLPLPGTGDVTVFKIWTHAAATAGVSQMYGVGGSPPERRLHDYDGRQATVDYPPVALYELALAGMVYGAACPGFPDGTALTVAVKLLPVAAEVGIVWLLVAAMRRWAPSASGTDRYAGLAFWLSPAVLLTSAVLGYLDALFALPATGALVAAAAGRAFPAGVLLSLAVLTKPQAVFFAPVVGLALLPRLEAVRGVKALRGLAVAAGAAALTAGTALSPVVHAGAWPNFMQAMASFSRHDMLSGQAANLWWVVTYVLRAAYAVAEMGVAGAFFSPVRRPLAIMRIVELGYPNPRPAATLVVMAAVGWALWRARRVRDLPRMALLGAWIVYAYFVLSVQVHENHFYLILPPLALAAAALPEWRVPFWVLSGVFALNLNLFYGFGDRVGFAVPRMVTGVDATVLLSLGNLLLFAWFTRRLGPCLDGRGPGVTEGPASTLHPPRSSSP